MALDRLYTDKQIGILRRSLSRDWYMMINHGAVRAGKTKLDNDLFDGAETGQEKCCKSRGSNSDVYSGGGIVWDVANKHIARDYGRLRPRIPVDRHGNFTLFGVYVVTTFTGSIAGLKQFVV